MFEHLEMRRLLAATAVLDNGIVKITGTPEDDHIGLRVQVGDATDFLIVTAEGEEILAVPLNEVTGVQARLAAGDDALKTDPQLPRPITAFGDGGSDALSGGAVADLLNGGPDDDVLLASRGPDDFVGGLGVDAVSYREYLAPVRVTLDGLPNDGALVNANSASASPAATEGDNVRFDIEVVIGGAGGDYMEGVTSMLAVLFPAIRFEGGTGRDMLVAGHSAGRAVLDGGEGNDDLIGGHQPNVLLGGPGNDRMVGNNAPDEFFGGTGFDTADYSAKSLPLHITLDNRPNDGEIGTPSHLAEHDNVHRDVERVVGGSNNDFIALTVPGLTAVRNDVALEPTASFPASIAFEGGPGNDTLVAELPKLAVDPTGEIIVASNTGITGTQLGDRGSVGPTLSNATRFFAILSGDGGNDRLVGSRLNDQLNGGSGFDTEFGNDGNDHFLASFGGDDMSGGNGIDTVNYSAFGGGVFVTIDDIANDGLPVLSPGPGDNVRTDIENVIGTRSVDQISGSDRANRLDGLGGGDVIHGMDGNDTVTGGPGSDRLFGDGGDDLLISRDGEVDHVDGGEGTDKAIADLLDELINIEGVST